MFELGFTWSAMTGTFYLKDIWCSYWEQICRYDVEEWKEFLEQVNEAIKRKI